MRFAYIAAALAVLLATPRIGVAEGEAARIEISKGKRPLLVLSGEEAAGQFSIWTGPGTASSAVDAHDIADWRIGAVEPPRSLRIYKVRFYCAARGETPKESVPSSLCYGVRYGIDPDSGLGYIQIPADDDREFPGNTRTIYRGVEGRWFVASERWEELVRPQLDAALAPTQRDSYPYQQPSIYTPPPASRTAVGAKPAIPTRPR